MRSLEKTIRRPSGEYDGRLSMAGLTVSRVSSLPSGVMVQISSSWLPNGPLAKTMRDPSADQSGWTSFICDEKVSCLTIVPSAAATYSS
ncbi:hypothetical protein D3C83_16630 [compost metagenome]